MTECFVPLVRHNGKLVNARVVKAPAGATDDDINKALTPPPPDALLIQTIQQIGTALVDQVGVSRETLLEAGVSLNEAISNLSFPEQDNSAVIAAVEAIGKRDQSAAILAGLKDLAETNKQIISAPKTAPNPEPKPKGMKIKKDAEGYTVSYVY